MELLFPNLSTSCCRNRRWSMSFQSLPSWDSCRWYGQETQGPFPSSTKQLCCLEWTVSMHSLLWLIASLELAMNAQCTLSTAGRSVGRWTCEAIILWLKGSGGEGCLSSGANSLCLINIEMQSPASRPLILWLLYYYLSLHQQHILLYITTIITSYY